MLLIGLIVGGVAGYIAHAKQADIVAFVNDKAGKWFKR